MPLNANSKYPSQRAYVLKLSGQATPDAPAGCIEHMVSGRKLEFASGLELLEAIAVELRASGGAHAMPERVDGAKR